MKYIACFSLITDKCLVILTHINKEYVIYLSSHATMKYIACSSLITANAW
uniref:Uncharacterized protein n=1 Tax=Rhizophagus irregularis (strain DAOM 181602 / DAOM 197198 / MUCL 43194) TaxID=747089 RepID=U9UI94_RHIID